MLDKHQKTEIKLLTNGKVCIRIFVIGLKDKYRRRVFRERGVAVTA